MADTCSAHVFMNGGWCKASGPAEFVNGCVMAFIGATAETKTSGLVVVTVDMTEPKTEEAAPAADHEDKIGDTIDFFSDEDYRQENFTNPYTATFEIVNAMSVFPDGNDESHFWCVQTTTNGFPVSNNDEINCNHRNKNTINVRTAHFATRGEVIGYMAEFGFKPV